MSTPSAPPPSYGDAVSKDNYQNTGYSYGGYADQHPSSNPVYGANSQQQWSGYGQPQPQPHTNTVEPELGGHHVFNESSFSDKAIRHQFIRKVYLILMAQLLFTFSIVALFVFIRDVKVWVQHNLWLYILSYVTFLVTYIVLVCCPGVRRNYPGNYIALAVFTIAFSFVCATIASFHNANAVLIAAGITAFVTLGVSLFACQTKIDFTMCTGLIFAACLVLLLVGLLYLIIFLVIPPGENGRNYYYLQCAYGGIVALILCLFLVFDTQRVVGGKNRRYQLSPEEHIVGAMELYLDIVYLFLIILSFFGGGSRD